MGAFEEGREFEGLVRQIRSIFDQIDSSDDRNVMRRTFCSTLNDIFPRAQSLAEKYAVSDSERREIVHLHACCVDEDFYQRYKKELDSRRAYVLEHG